jgi:nucleotide-binding universal stress UspA family protein
MPVYATTLAVLTGSVSDEAVLTAARRLSGADGLVRALAIRRDPVRVVPMVGEAGAAAAAQMMEVIEQQSKERVARARSAFEAWRSKTSDSRTEFQELLGHPAETPTLCARNADIVVVPHPRQEDEPMAASLVEACLFGSGRPLLVVPPITSAAFGKSIAVFWNGSRIAARALGDAQPLLADSQSVLVLTAGDLHEEVPTCEAVAQRLQAQGLKATARALPDGNGAALASAAIEAGCDLVVMGGYGHSRLREMILGGVTRYMLSSASVPVLMAH